MVKKSCDKSLSQYILTYIAVLSSREKYSFYLNVFLKSSASHDK